jgi:ring-1,2-phenylacetyl-CoA epoxidase subunit PaaE
VATPQFHALTVRDVRSETADAISVGFNVPPELREAYRFREGQFLTLQAQVAGDTLRRSYSICVPVQHYADGGELRVGIKRVVEGRFSNWANDTLRAGDRIEVMTPDGRFHGRSEPQRARHVVGFAGGSGITPMLSLIGTLLEAEPDCRFSLVYGNRTIASIMFLETLEGLRNRYLGRLRLLHVLSDEAQEIDLMCGLLDRARCTRLITTVLADAPIDEAFICGPAPMMDAAEAALLEFGLPRDRIRIERFGSPATPSATSSATSSVSSSVSSSATASASGGRPTGVGQPSLASQPAGAPSAQVSLLIDGKERRLDLALDGPSLLDAGLAAGAPLPYACKAGVCSTCRCKVLEGEVRMTKNYTLEAQEIDAGFVLSCQAHPITERVVVSFDER